MWLRRLRRGRAEDVEPHLDLGGTVERHVALRAGDAHRLAGGRERASVLEIDRDEERVAVAGELDVFHDVCPLFVCRRCGFGFALAVNGKGYRCLVVAHDFVVSVAAEGHASLHGLLTLPLPIVIGAILLDTRALAHLVNVRTVEHDVGRVVVVTRLHALEMGFGIVVHCTCLFQGGEVVTRAARVFVLVGVCVPQGDAVGFLLATLIPRAFLIAHAHLRCSCRLLDDEWEPTCLRAQHQLS